MTFSSNAADGGNNLAVTFTFIFPIFTNDGHDYIGSTRQEIPYDLHVPISLLPMSQMRRLTELDPLHFGELIEERL